MLEELKSSQKQDDSPRGTRPMGNPAVVCTTFPRMVSVTIFHISRGMDSNSGTQTKQASLSYLLPYSLVTCRDSEGGGRILKFMIALNDSIGNYYFPHFEVESLQMKAKTFVSVDCLMVVDRIYMFN